MVDWTSTDLRLKAVFLPRKVEVEPHYAVLVRHAKLGKLNVHRSISQNWRDMLATIDWTVQYQWPIEN